MKTLTKFSAQEQLPLHFWHAGNVTNLDEKGLDRRQRGGQWSLVVATAPQKTQGTSLLSDPRKFVRAVRVFNETPYGEADLGSRRKK